MSRLSTRVTASAENPVIPARQHSGQRALADPESDSIRLYDPKLACRCSVGENKGGPLDESNDGVFILPLRPKNDDAGIICRRVCLNIGEIAVQCDERSPLSLGPCSDRRILCSGQSFIGNRVGFQPAVAEGLSTLTRQVLIDLQLQTVCSRGRSAVPSRASSAA